MSLGALAEAVMDVRDATPRTPVLVKPKYLDLKKSFLVALCDALLDAAPSRLGDASPSSAPISIQIDWLRSGVWSIFSDPLARIWAARLAERFSRSRDVPMQFQITSTISRPRSDHSIVVGICDDSETLSPWTRPIHLASTPKSDLQLSRTRLID